MLMHTKSMPESSFAPHCQTLPDIPIPIRIPIPRDWPLPSVCLCRAKADAGFAFLPEPVDIAHMVLPWWKQIPLEVCMCYCMCQHL